MESLLAFLKKIHFFLIFLLLEAISLSLVVGSDEKRNGLVLTSCNRISGNIYDIASSYMGYFNLRGENIFLTRELAQLKSFSQMAWYRDTASFKFDTTFIPKYQFIPASILKNSVNKTNNFLTLNVGSKHGIHPDMGVVSSQGIVGVVVSVSENFCLVISILNKKIGFSAKLKNNNFYGSMVWPGDDYRYAILNEIPNHVEVNKGDTVVTSGYSAIFPMGIVVGTVDDFSKNSDDNFYTIKLELASNLKNIQQVFVIHNTMQEEQLELEKHESEFVQ